MPKFTRSTKFAVYFTGLDKKQHADTCYDIARAQSEITRAANKVAHISYLIQMGMMEHPLNAEGKQVPLASIPNHCLRVNDPWTPFKDGRTIYEPAGPRVNAGNIAVLGVEIASRIKTDLPKIRKGEAQLCTFNKLPIPIRSSSITLSFGPEGSKDEFLFDVGLWGGMPRGEGRVLLSPILGQREHSQREILRRIITGQYKHGNAKLFKDERKGKWMLSLSWSGEVAAKTGDFIAGIDLGIMTTATISYVDAATGKGAPFRDRVTIPKTVMHAWNAVQSERRERLRRNRRVFEPSVEEMKPGRGITRKLRPAAPLADKKARLTQEAVRQVASAVVKVILKRGCRAVALEDLSWSHESMLKQTEGLSNRDKARARKNFLNWLQGTLRATIHSVLEREGVQSFKVDACDSSNTCSACGTVYRRPKLPKGATGPRPYCKGFGRLDQSTFKCSCGFEEHADYNAGVVLGQRGRLKLLQEEAEAAKAAKEVKEVEAPIAVEAAVVLGCRLSEKLTTLDEYFDV